MPIRETRVRPAISFLVHLARTFGLLLLVVGSAQAQTGPLNLGTLGGSWASADAVSDNGVVVGRSVLADDVTQRPFVWTSETGMIGLTLGGSLTVITDLSRTGIVVGYGLLADNVTYRAFVWKQPGGLQMLEPPRADGWSRAEAVSDNGVVFGLAQLCTEDVACGQSFFAWTEGTGMIDLSELGLATAVKGSGGTRLSATGMLVGSYTSPSGERHAFAWTIEHGVEDLGTLGGSMSEALGVNDEGMVVGDSFLEGDVVKHAFVWTRGGGGMRDLGTLGGPDSHAIDVSDTGFVVGTSSLPGDDPLITGPDRAFRWSAATTMVDLGTLGGSSSTPEEVSNDGVVTGTSRTVGDLESHQFAWVDGLGMADILAGAIKKAACKKSVLILRRCREIMSENGVIVIADNVWSRTTGPQILSLGGSVTVTYASSDTGIVVGAGWTPDDAAWRPFVWTQERGLAELGVLDDFTSAEPYEVNNSGLAVGVTWQDVEPFAQRAVLWITRTTQTTVSASANTSAYGTPVVFTATVSSDGGTPGGPVEFFDGLVSLGTANIAGGTAALSLANLAVGSHSITASYVGDGAFPVSTSGAVVVTVVAANVAPTPTGSGVVSEPVATLPDGSTAPVTIAFGNVTGAGTTTVTTSTAGPPPPDGFKIVGGMQPIYYDVSTTATFTGVATLCFSWSEGQIKNENNARLFHLENGTWADITTSRDTTKNIVCGQTTSFSPFFVGEERIAGFYQPVDNLQVLNIVKAGAAVPVKFSLGGNEGLDIFLTGYPGSTPISCPGAGAGDAIEQTAIATASSLAYDSSSDRYTYVWKTSKDWSGTCRQFRIKLKDGTIKSANFSFTR